jgi:hypothetical protein
LSGGAEIEAWRVFEQFNNGVETLLAGFIPTKVA